MQQAQHIKCNAFDCIFNTREYKKCINPYVDIVLDKVLSKEGIKNHFKCDSYYVP